MPEQQFGVHLMEVSDSGVWMAILSCGAVYNAVQDFLTFEFEDDILKCDHSNESYQVVLSYGAVYYAVRDGSNF